MNGHLAEVATNLAAVAFLPKHLERRSSFREIWRGKAVKETGNKKLAMVSGAFSRSRVYKRSATCVEHTLFGPGIRKSQPYPHRSMCILDEEEGVVPVGFQEDYS